MIRGIYILCEGQSEEEFVNAILRPYFLRFKIYDVRPILMPTSKLQKGGDVKFDRLKHNVEILLKREKDIIVTSFIDFFKLKTDFPLYNESLTIADKISRVQFLENAMKNTIDNDRFIPYIQLHEFEGLLFASNKGFNSLPDLTTKSREVLNEATIEKDNPELLNDGFETAPSKRLEKLIPGFDKNKPFYGGIIAEENGIEIVLKRCKRFNLWIESLTEKFKI